MIGWVGYGQRGMDSFQVEIALLVWYLQSRLLSTTVNECFSNQYLKHSQFLHPMILVGRRSTETSSFVTISDTTASTGSFRCSNVNFNQCIQEQFQLKLTKNRIEIAETACQYFISFHFGPLVNNHSVVIQNRKPFSNRAGSVEMKTE